jgi:dihydrofolate reductase
MTLEPEVSLIALLSRDGFISRDQGVPWELPADKAHFRRYTHGKWLLVGRTTYEEMLGWFTPRHHVCVLTHRPIRSGPGIAFPDVESALRMARRAGAGELVVCGGGDCYLAAMPYATRLILTEVEDHLGRGVPFPIIDSDRWQQLLQLRSPADVQNSHAMTFRVLEQRPTTASAEANVEVQRRPLRPILQA